MSNGACRQNTALTWHINSCTPSVMTQRWGFAVVTGCPQEGHACHSSVPPHTKTSSRAGEVQRRSIRTSKALEQIPWSLSPSVFPSCYSSDAPAINVLKWRSKRLNNKVVSHLWSQRPAGLLCADTTWWQHAGCIKPYPGEKKPADMANFTLCLSVCKVAKVILVESSPSYANYWIWHWLYGGTWSKTVDWDKYCTASF